ncbi:MAG: SMR family transporter [Kosmotogaceae bacterium]
MVYLLLAILSSSSIAMIFKVTEGRDYNRLAVTTFNYLSAFFTALIMVAVERPAVGPGGGSPTEVILKGQRLFSLTSSVVWGLSLGIVSGLFFFLSFIFYQKSVRESGASLSGAFGKLGILIPMLLSLLVWKEYPKTLQWVGIGLAVFSIVLVNNPVGSGRRNLKPALILLFITGGLAEFMNKLFQNYTVSGYKNVFLFSVFASAFAISVVFLKRSGKSFHKGEVLVGLIVGLPNLFSSFFLIMALEEMKGSVVFPVYSAGSVVMISLGSLLFFGEKLKKFEMISLGMVLVSLIIINI